MVVKTTYKRLFDSVLTAALATLFTRAQERRPKRRKNYTSVICVLLGITGRLQNTDLRGARSHQSDFFSINATQ